MPLRRATSIFDRRLVTDFWELGRLYWTTPAARWGRVLLAMCIMLELGAVLGAVQLATAQRDIFDAVQDRQLPMFLTAIATFAALGLVFVLISAYRVYVRNILAMRWRERLTEQFVQRWMDPNAYWLREMHGQEIDNPDQRIAEDANNFVTSALGLSLSLLAALAALVFFAGMLWRLSGDWPLHFGGHELRIPGLMMWVAIIYGLVATWFTDRVGHPLAAINYDRLRAEADFRYGLVHFRDNVEAAVLARGEAVERRGALDRFGRVMSNWWLLIAAQRDVVLLTTGLAQANGIVPLLVAAPAFFAGDMTLGSLTQTQIAYAQVSGALAFFVNAYQEIAQWRANVERLGAFRRMLETTRVEVESARGIQVEPSTDGALRLIDLGLSLPDGRRLVHNANAALRPGDRIELFGPAGAGKTTLFRAMAGLWPFGTGSIAIPAGTRALFLPQRPYLPIGTLRAAVSYPSPAGTFSDEKIYVALHQLGLDRLANRLDDTEQWDQHLSVDEHQRLTIARLLLHEPDWIVMDDATEGLDADTEQRVYELFAKYLPKAGVLSIVNRPSASDYGRRRWELHANANGSAVLQTA